MDWTGLDSICTNLPLTIPRQNTTTKEAGCIDLLHARGPRPRTMECLSDLSKVAAS